MVRILSLAGISFFVLSLLTYVYYKRFSDKGVCHYRILTSNSFHAGVSDVFKEKFKEKYDCDIYFAVVNGANLISNLFNKQPAQYDVLIGLDNIQTQKISSHLISHLPLDVTNERQNQQQAFLVYDESPLTFFIRDSNQTHFLDLKSFIAFLETSKLTVAIPLATTSTLGTLFEKWVNHENLAREVLGSDRIKFVKSWSEAFGLFERKIVDGFLSFETSEIYFLNSNDVKKIDIASGHPNLKEYFAFSTHSKMSDQQKKEMIEFMLSDEIQNLLLKKNYMWPIELNDHEHSNLRTLKKIESSLID